MAEFICRLKAFFKGLVNGKDCHLSILEKKIGYHFRCRENLIEALTHSSVLGVLPPEKKDVTYERLEFLGDAVLGLATVDFLMKKFPGENEGELTKKKSLLVSKSILAKKAEKLGLKEYIILSNNAHRDGVHAQDSIQADVMEAIIGALYNDGGFKVAMDFVLNFVLSSVQEDIEDRDFVNYKSKLQEWVQRESGEYPEYIVRSTRGPEHDKIFFVEVNVEGKVRGKGRGKNKKDAEQMAAKEALSEITKE